MGDEGPMGAPGPVGPEGREGRLGSVGQQGQDGELVGNYVGCPDSGGGDIQILLLYAVSVHEEIMMEQSTILVKTNHSAQLYKALTIKVKAQLMERDAIFIQSLANNCPM